MGTPLGAHVAFIGTPMGAHENNTNLALTHGGRASRSARIRTKCARVMAPHRGGVPRSRSPSARTLCQSVSYVLCFKFMRTHAHGHAVTLTRQPVQVLALTSPQGFSVAAAAWRFAAAASQVTLTPPAQFVARPPGLALPPQLLAHSRAELAIRVRRLAAAAALCASL